MNRLVLGIIIGVCVLVGGLYAIQSDFVQNKSEITQYCLFENDDLLNYLRNPNCDRPQGVEIDTGHQCVYKHENGFYIEAKCEEPGKAWTANGCVYIKQEDDQVLGICP